MPRPSSRPWRKNVFMIVCATFPPSNRAALRQYECYSRRSSRSTLFRICAQTACHRRPFFEPLSFLLPLLFRLPSDSPSGTRP